MLLVSLVVFLLLIFIGLIALLRGIISKNVALATGHLEGLSEVYGKKEKEIERQLQEAKQKAQEILSKAEEEARQKNAQLIKEAEDEKSKILNAAQGKVDEMMQQAGRSSKTLLSEINKKIEEKARAQAVELLQNSLPEQFRREIHRCWVEDLIAGDLEWLEHLHVEDKVQEAKVTSAFSLTQSQRDALEAKIKEKLGYPINLKEELDASIISGLVVHIGNLVFDGSLRSKIQKAAYT